MNELKALEDINHPHIPKVFELFEDKKNYCVVMELVTGGNLAKKLKTNKTFSENQTQKIIDQVLSAVNYMHCEKNIIHRDIKPENILCMP